MNPAIWNQNGIDPGVRKSGVEINLFLVNRNRGRNRFLMAMLCWKRNRNQPQCFFLAESESISVSWDQAQVCPTQYEKCETSISFLNIASI